MIKLKAKESFTLGRFAEIKIIERVNNNSKDGHLDKGDLFECNTDLAKYLLNETPNPANRAVVEIVEVIPNKVKVEEEKSKRIRTKKVAKK